MLIFYFNFSNLKIRAAVSWHLMMSSSLCGVCMVFLGVVLSRATAQAPGDGKQFCADLSMVDPPLYHANAIILMESNNYINLLTPLTPLDSIWQQVDNDNATGDDDSPFIVS